MKRSNLFLGLTTGFLALASFAFAKSHSKGSIHTAKCRTASAPSQDQCAAFIKLQNLALTPGSIKVFCSNPGSGNNGTLVTTVNCLVTLIDQQG